VLLFVGRSRHLPCLVRVVRTLVDHCSSLGLIGVLFFYPSGALLELGERLRRLVTQPAKDTLQPSESLDQRRLLPAAASASASACVEKCT
jgi:hypothetical protein